MKRLICCFLLSLFALACSTAKQEDPEPMSGEEEVAEPSPTHVEEEPRKYKRPDGGFGTLDDAREVRGATEQQGEESESALEETNQ